MNPPRRATGALLLAAGLISGCAPSEGPDEVTAPTLAEGEYSTLDDAGEERIIGSLTARLDMSSGTLEKADVGLPDDAVGIGVSTGDPDEKIQITIEGPSGDVTGESDNLRFMTVPSRSDFRALTYFLTADSAEEYFELIRDGVDQYGIDSGDAERWIASTEANPEKITSYSLTSGMTTGLEVNYDLRYDGAEDVQVIIVNVSPVR